MKRAIAPAAIIGENRMPKERVKNACRDRHACRIVDEREKKILPDIAHRRLRQPPRFQNAGQITTQQRESMRFRARHRCRFPWRFRHPRQPVRRVIDAVSSHGDDAACGPQAGDHLLLSLRRDLGFNLIDAEAAGDGGCSSARIAVIMTMRMPAFFRSGDGRCAVDLIGSSMPITPATWPSAATKTEVLPPVRCVIGCLLPGRRINPQFRQIALLTNDDGFPSTSPRAPLPVGESKSCTCASRACSRSASATMAAANGCSLKRSTLPARPRFQRLSLRLSG